MEEEEEQLTDIQDIQADRGGAKEERNAAGIDLTDRLSHSLAENQLMQRRFGPISGQAVTPPSKPGTPAVERFR